MLGFLCLYFQFLCCFSLRQCAVSEIRSVCKLPITKTNTTPVQVSSQCCSKLSCNAVYEPSLSSLFLFTKLNRSPCPVLSPASSVPKSSLTLSLFLPFFLLPLSLLHSSPADTTAHSIVTNPCLQSDWLAVQNYALHLTQPLLTLHRPGRGSLYHAVKHIQRLFQEGSTSMCREGVMCQTVHTVGVLSAN